MQIRRATFEDVPSVARIHVATWQTAYRDLLPAEYLRELSVERREVLWRQSIDSGIPELWVAVEASEVVGWVAFGAARDADAAPQTGEVWAIYVAPAHWSSGAGRLLWLQARQRLIGRGFTAALLWTFARNQRAIRFYLAAGFAADGSATKSVIVGGRSMVEVRYVAALA
jgi:ribosomal protein S18 acetylase RimI-like enzyme